MKKVVLGILISAILFPLSAQLRPVNERREVPRVEKKKNREKVNPAEETASVPVVKYFEDEELVRIVSEAGTEFVIGEFSQSVKGTRTLNPYKINRYETTYNLWYKVRVWAESNGYVFSHPGQQGTDGGRGKAPTKSGKYQPVTTVCWYDVIVWCNAFSELMGRSPCYSYRNEIIRDATDTASCDLCQCDWNKNGYRLPTEAEWEYAARKTFDGIQSDVLASGQVDVNGRDDESVAIESIGWTAENSTATHTVGTAGVDLKTAEAAVPGSGKANGAGLYDMCGNVLEFCWDWQASYDAVPYGEVDAGPEFGSERVMRGGSWNKYTVFYGAGDRYSYDPNETYNFFGFRFAVSE